MPAYAPRKARARRVVMILALGLLGSALAVLLTLLYLLYMMRAPAPLPEADRLLMADHDMFLVVQPDLADPDNREALGRVLDTAIAEAPDTARTLAQYGLSEERAGETPLLMTFSAKIPDEGAWRWVGTVSLGRFRGAFWLADRALRRQSESGRLPYTVRSEGDLTLYEAKRPSRFGLNTLAIWRATGLAGSDPQAVSEVGAALADPPPSTAEEAPDTSGLFARGGVLRPDPFLEHLLKAMLGDSAETGPLGGALSRIDMEMEAVPGGNLLVRAAAPWREGADRPGATRAAGEILNLLHSQGWVGRFTADGAEDALRLEAEVTLPQERP